MSGQVTPFGAFLDSVIDRYSDLVVLLGEGSFHQIHGGVSTNMSEERLAEAYRRWHDQYAALRGDALVAKNRLDEAKAAYRLALEKSDPARSAAFRDSVQIRLDALGG